MKTGKKIKIKMRSKFFPPIHRASMKEERVCKDCGGVFIRYAYHKDAHCEKCRAKYSDYYRGGQTDEHRDNPMQI